MRSDSLLVLCYCHTMTLSLRVVSQTSESLLTFCIWRRPYYQTLGETFLDEYEEETGCIGPWAFTSCGTNFGWLMPFLIGIYLLITNVVLTNLLIAMFNDTVCCLCMLVEFYARFSHVVRILVHHRQGAVETTLGSSKLRYASASH